MHHIPFVEQKFSQVGTVLTGDAGYQSCFCHQFSFLGPKPTCYIVSGPPKQAITEPAKAIRVPIILCRPRVFRKAYTKNLDQRSGVLWKYNDVAHLRYFAWRGLRA